MKTWLLNRLKERSTWAGIITLASLAGLTLSPEQREQIVVIGTTLVGLLLTFTTDPKLEVKIDAEPTNDPVQTITAGQNPDSQ